MTEKHKSHRFITKTNTRRDFPPPISKKCQCGEILTGIYVRRCPRCGALVILRSHAKYWSNHDVRINGLSQKYNH